MIELSDEQTAAIAAMEESSFRRYCALLGCDPDHRQAELISRIRQTFQASFAMAPPEAPRPSEAWLRENCPFLFVDDYWAVIRHLNDENKKLIAHDIAGAIDAAPIDAEYLRRLADGLAIPCPSAISADWLRRLLEAVPTVTSFDLQFNAYVGP